MGHHGVDFWVAGGDGTREKKRVKKKEIGVGGVKK